MSTKNIARKSTGPRASSTSPSPQSSSTTRTLRQRGPTQTNNSQGDSSDSDTPTQPMRTRNQSTPNSSAMSLRPSTSRAADDEEQSTLRLSNGGGRNLRRNHAAESSSDTTSDSDEAPGVVKEKEKPKKKRKVNRRKNSSPEASDGDVQPSSSSKASLASSTVSSSNITAVASPNRTTMQPSTMASLVNKCVYFLLIADQKKCLIKKRDILKHVFAAAESKFYNDVMVGAGNILKKTYGMEIVSSQKRRGEYMLINVLHDVGVQEFMEYSPQELQKRGFIFYLLTLIFMNEQSITDGELASALKALHIDMNGRQAHPVFGDINKYLKELASQNYIERKEINKDPPQYEFVWGERAYQEVDKKDLLQFACEILEGTRPEEWILQYNDAMSLRQQPA